MRQRFTKHDLFHTGKRLLSLVLAMAMLLCLFASVSSIAADKNPTALKLRGFIFREGGPAGKIVAEADLKSGTAYHLTGLVENTGDAPVTRSEFGNFYFSLNYVNVGYTQTTWSINGKTSETAPIPAKTTVELTYDGGGGPIWTPDGNGEYRFNLCAVVIGTDGNHYFGDIQTIKIGGNAEEEAPSYKIDWTPPTPPTDYTPLTDWPSADNTGLLDGWSKDRRDEKGDISTKTLQILRGPVNEGSVKYYNSTFANIYKNPGNTNSAYADWPEWNRSLDAVKDASLGDGREYVDVTFPADSRDNSVPFWQHQEGVAFETYKLRYANLVIDDAYISANGGRVKGGADDGQFVIENKYIIGGLKISAANVTVRNCYLEASYGHFASMNVNTTGVIMMEQGSSAIISNCELNGLAGVMGGIFYNGDSVAVLKCNIYGSCDGVLMWDYENRSNGKSNNNFLIQDNYMHSFSNYVSNGHTDGFHIHGANTGHIKHNHIDNPPPVATSGILSFSDWRAVYGIMIENNLWAGGSYTIYVGDRNNKYPYHNVWLLNNVFSNRYYPQCAAYGVWSGTPTDGWADIFSFDWASFDPETQGSFRFGNTLWDEAANTFTDVDLNRPPHKYDEWVHTGNAGVAGAGMHELDWSAVSGSGTGTNVALSFKIMSMRHGADATIAYGGADLNEFAQAGAPYPEMTMLIGPRAYGVFDMYDGNKNGGAAGGWVRNDSSKTVAQKVANGAIPFDPMIWYEIKLVANTVDKSYSGYVRMLQDDKKTPYVGVDSCGFTWDGEFKVVGENYGFRNATYPDIGKVFVGPGDANAYLVRDHYPPDTAGFPDPPDDEDEPVETDIVFEDMTGRWSESAVNMLYKAGIVNGVENGGKLYFNPENAITRVEFIKLMVAAKNIDLDAAEVANTTLDFTDSADIPDWGIPYIKAAVYYELVGGRSNGDGTVSVAANAQITREETFTLLYRAFFANLELDPNIAEFTDMHEISEYAKHSIFVLAELNITNGYEDGSIRPKNNITREESAALIYRSITRR